MDSYTWIVMILQQRLALCSLMTSLPLLTIYSPGFFAQTQGSLVASREDWLCGAIFLSVSCRPWRWLWAAQPTEPRDSEGESYLPSLPVTNQLYNIRCAMKSEHNQSQHQPQGCDTFIKINWASLLLCQGSWNIPRQYHLCRAQLQRLPSTSNGVSMGKMVRVDKARQGWPDIRYALLPSHGEP